MVTQLQSKITAHLLLPRRAFLIPWGATSRARLQRMAAHWFKRQQQEGWKMPRNPQQLGQSNEKVPLISPPVSRYYHDPPPNPKQGSTWADPPVHPPRAVTAARGCSAGQGGNVHSPDTIHLLCPTVLLFPICPYLYTTPGPTCEGLASAFDNCSLPAEILSSLQLVLQQVWALPRSRAHTAPSTRYLCSYVHTYHPKNNPDIFVIVQPSSFLAHRNETNSFFFLILMLKDWEPLNRRWLWNAPALRDSGERDKKFRK